MASLEMLRYLALVRTEVSEELNAPIIRVLTTATSQKTPYFMNASYLNF
jgi:hypothetical protein